MYKEYIQAKINEVIKDELTASIIYNTMADSAEGIHISEVVEVLRAHGQEEFDHFKKLSAFAYNHGLKPIISIDSDKINSAPCELGSILVLTQSLETKAIADYKEIATIAMENDDLETYNFFKDLMEVEMEHFDELAPLIGQKRELVGKELAPSQEPRLTIRSIVGL